MPSFGNLLPDQEFLFNVETLEVEGLGADPVAYGITPLFVFRPVDTGYLVGPVQGIVLTSDQRSLLVWVDKALRTPRGAFPIYSDDYGTDFAAQIGYTDYAALRGTIQEDVRRCLTVHPLITDVSNVTLTRLANDAVEIAMTISDSLSGQTNLVVTL